MTPLRTQIRTAKSSREIDSLLTEGLTNYKKSTSRTQNRWRIAANKRLEELKRGEKLSQ